MLQEFKHHIETQFPFLHGKQLLVAVSGGIDSVVLTHLLNQLHYNISLAHCNFSLRKKESDQDEEFVKKIAQKTSNQIFTKVFNTEEISKKEKKSIQQMARELRYQWFEELVIAHSFDYVMTAHHANDNLETLLINLTRGTGLDGLTGIPVQNGNIVRPLLPFSRERIEQYARENDIEWREDASNASTKYLRNKIRHQVIPILKEINPNLLESIQKTIQFLQQAKTIVGEQTQSVKNDVMDVQDDIVKINISKLKNYQHPKAYLYELLKEYQFTEWEDVYHLLKAQSGKQVFSKTHRLIKDREYLLLTEKMDENASISSYMIEAGTDKISHPITLIFESHTNGEEHSKNSIYLDKDLLKYPLQLRKWKEGDYFYPTGMQGKKKISKYFKDEKFSLLEKQKTWLLTDANNEVIWVVNHRQNRKFTGRKNLKITVQ